MKIVHALGWYFPERLGGTEIYVAHLCREAQNAGFSPIVTIPDPRVATPTETEHEGVPVWRRPSPSTPTRDEAQGRSAARGAELFERWLAEQRPDVFHCHTFVTGLGLPELKMARRHSRVVVVTTHSSALGWICQRGSLLERGEKPCDGIASPRRCAECMLTERGLPTAAATLVSRIPSRVSGRLGRLPGKMGTMLGAAGQIAENLDRQRQMLDLVDRFVVLTGFARKALLENGAPPEKVVVNRLGVGPQFVGLRPARPPAAAPLRIGYLGRFDAIKGVEDLARAIASLPPELPLRFEFRGPARTDADRERRDAVQGLLRSDSRAEFPPEIAPGDVPKTLATWDVACFPSRCHEGGPTAALEARAMGAPAIGSAIGGLAEIVRDEKDGALFAPGDVAALASLLRRLATNPSLVDAWRAALPPVRTMTEVAADYFALYETTLAGDSARSPVGARAPR
ncbi:MAG TPA: glycosyltransferase [Planctomycetia bacterium]|nr:glycosyltransferase [Planctomycetia bacterium]